MLTRIDKQKAKTEAWDTSISKEAVFAPSGVKWAKKLADAQQKLFVRVSSSRGVQKDATFNLEGSTEAKRLLRKMRSSCAGSY